MDIHKPRPWHNMREFLKELGTIALGVVVALAAEQAVEWLHWQGEVTAARAALMAEMESATNVFYARRLAIAPCLDSKLDTIGAAIEAVAAGRQPDLHGLVFNTIGSNLIDSEWQSHRASQTLTHFPRQELTLMSRFYGEMPDARNFELYETAAWGNLSVLQDSRQKLGPADLAQLRVNYHLARRFLLLINNNSAGQVALAKQLGIRPAAFTPTQIANSCNRVTETVKY